MNAADVSDRLIVETRLFSSDKKKYLIKKGCGQMVSLWHITMLKGCGQTVHLWPAGSWYFQNAEKSHQN